LLVWTVGQLDRILWTSDSEARLKTEKSGGVAAGEGERGDDVVGLLVRERRSLPVKKRQSCLQVKCREKWSVAIAVRRICGVGVY